MIRKLTEKDHELVLSYLSEEPSINLFIIGDIEAFGYESSFQELWGEFDDEKNIKAILLKFYQSYIFYSKDHFDEFGFSEIMKKTGEPVFLSGKTDLIERFEKAGHLKLAKKQVTYFAECRSSDDLIPNDFEIKKASIEDIDRIIELRKTIHEFVVNKDAKDILRKSILTNTSRTYFTEDHGMITSCASTAAENSISAMVVGVCTKKEYRQQGLATGIMQKLFKNVMDEGKILCLFYRLGNYKFLDLWITIG